MPCGKLSAASASSSGDQETDFQLRPLAQLNTLSLLLLPLLLPAAGNVPVPEQAGFTTAGCCLSSCGQTPSCCLVAPTHDAALHSIHERASSPFPGPLNPSEACLDAGLRAAAATGREARRDFEGGS